MDEIGTFKRLGIKLKKKKHPNLFKFKKEE